MSVISKIYNTLRNRLGKAPFALTLTIIMLLSVVVMVLAGEYVVTPADPNHEVNGAWFMQFLPEDATGTGLFNPFVRVSANSDVVQGYNTDYRPLQFEEDSSWTDSIPLSDVPYFLYEGTLYREFQLDINQTNKNPLISLDEVQIWLGGADAANITGFVEEGVETDFGSFPGFALQEVYNLDADDDNDLILDYSNAAGSGKRDLKLLVPDDYFKPYDEPVNLWVLVVNNMWFSLPSLGSTNPIMTALKSGVLRFTIPFQVLNGMTWMPMAFGMRVNLVWKAGQFVLKMLKVANRFVRQRMRLVSTSSPCRTAITAFTKNVPLPSTRGTRASPHPMVGAAQAFTWLHWPGQAAVQMLRPRRISVTTRGYQILRLIRPAIR